MTKLRNALTETAPIAYWETMAIVGASYTTGTLIAIAAMIAVHA